MPLSLREKGHLPVARPRAPVKQRQAVPEAAWVRKPREDARRLAAVAVLTAAARVLRPGAGLPGLWFLREVRAMSPLLQRA